MNTPYNPADWYWLIAGHVYSSLRNIYVDAADATYVAWKDANGSPPVASTEADVWPAVSNVLPAWLFDGATFVQPTATTHTKAQLKAYTASARYDKEVGGIAIGGMSVTTDRESQAMINGAYNMAARDATFTTKWKGADGGFTALDAATIIVLAIAIGQHVAACFSVEASVAAQIDAGTLTTTSEVNAAFAAITT